MITFVTVFHNNIIDVAFYSLTYMLMEDRIYGALIGAPAFFKLKDITV